MYAPAYVDITNYQLHCDDYGNYCGNCCCHYVSVIKTYQKSKRLDSCQTISYGNPTLVL